MATFAQGFDAKGQIAFGSPFTHYRRNRATPQTGFEPAPSTGQAAIGFSQNFTHYRRNRATSQTGLDIRMPAIGFSPDRLHKPPRRVLTSPGVLVEVHAAPLLLGDSGIEIIYKIPDKLAIRPHLIAPPFGSRHRLGSPILVWTASAGADYYEVHIARDVAFTQRVTRINTDTLQYQTGIPFGGTYYWRVRAVADSGAYSDFSEVWTFTVPAFLPAADDSHQTEGAARLLNQFQAGN